ncbi:MAG: ABC transporter permease [Hoeflea sp.]|uniref:ABC transporter permease n=1 Tax=Hoeflea sp. TaxID=1940281 RepID=UPI002731C77D|nr:ABC transporter permease [Hoeflea sp.]MDP2118480.1 ABC transporter permease [Hoeflea sp.]
MGEGDLGLWTVLLAMIGGAIRVSTPFIFVSLGECLTERSGRINLGLEGTLVFGAMSGYAVAYETSSAWAGVLAAALAGTVFGLFHGWVCKLPRVNDIAIGIALMLLGMGLAFFFGKPYIQPVAPDLPAIPLGFWSSSPQVEAALRVNVLFVLGIALAFFIAWLFRSTRIGLVIRVVGDSSDAARAMGISVDRVRLLATAAGGALAGIGGAYLSLYYPGSWNEGISSGQGLMAVALVIFARWNPVNCIWAALLFGAAGALGPALQSIGISKGYYLSYAAPYVLTLILLIATSSTTRAVRCAPGELSITK